MDIIEKQVIRIKFVFIISETELSKKVFSEEHCYQSLKFILFNCFQSKICENCKSSIESC